MRFRLFNCLSIFVLVSFSVFSSYAAELTITPEDNQYRTLPVTVQADVSTGNNGYLFKFRYRGITTNNRWVTVQNWTENNQYVIDTTSMHDTYSFKVVAKNATSKIRKTIHGYQITEGTPLTTVNFSGFNLQNCFNDVSMQHEWAFVEQVTTLNCNGRNINDLSGIEALFALETLNLAQNQLSHIHPLSNLPNLEKLELYSNQLMTLAGIESMTGLTYLDVSYNQFYDVYPLLSPGMTQLQTLNLSGNSHLQFAEVHQVLMNNPGLKDIGLADIAIGPQFPELFGPSGHYALTALDLSRTGIQDLSTLSNYNTLKVLRLSGNQIDYPGMLHNMTQLRELDLSDNRIVYMYDLSVYPQLAHLNLSNNPLDMVFGLNMLQSLQQLNLSNTLLTDSSALNGINQLTELHLSGLTIPGHELLNAAQQNPQLTALSLAGANLNGQFFSTDNWPMLEKLDISHAGIVDLHVMSTSLKELNAAGNQLMNTYSLMNLNTLELLDLSGNSMLPFNEIDNIIRNNPQLTELGLSDIQVGFFPTYQNPTGQFYKFSKLSLDRTGLSTDLSSLDAYYRLKHLSIAGNQLMVLAGIESMTGLTYLDVSDNQFYDVYPLLSPGMTQLQTLNLSGNSHLQFAEVHQVLMNNPGLKDIGLADIAIGPQFPELFGPSGHYALTALDLSRTGIQDLSTLSNYNTLKVLRLSGNQIDYPGMLHNMTQLRELDLSDNRIVYMYDLSVYPQLAHLNLSNNPLDMVFGLNMLQSLQQLNLSNTLLTDSSALNGINQLTELHLSGLTIPGHELLNAAQQNPQLTALSLAGANLNGQFFSTDNWPMLEKLDISHAGIVDLHVMSTSLKELNAAGNQLMNTYSLMNLNTLELLDLSGNSMLPFNEIDNIIRNNPQLTELGLSDIQVGFFPTYQNPTGQFYKFSKLSLDRTGLSTDLSSLDAYYRLKHLSIAGNQLMVLAGIESMTGLTYLDVSDNQFYDVYPLLSPGMTQLQTLNLSGNSHLQFAEVHQVLMNNPGLKDIGLADIAIGPQFPELFGPSGHYALTSLDLSNTGVNDLHTLTIYNGLEKLELESNNIHSVFGLESLLGLTLLNVVDNLLIDCIELGNLKNMLPNLEIMSPSQCL